MATLSIPPGCSADNLLAYGLTSLVFHNKSQNTVIKAPRGLKENRDIKVENEIYQRLGVHDGLLQYYGSEFYDDRIAICLEWAPNGQLSKFIENSCNNINRTRQL